MKNVLIGIFLFGLFSIGFSQQQEENAFQQSENQATGNSEKSALGGVGDTQTNGGSTGNLPGEDEIPIDDYLPLLAIVGSALVIYQFKSKKSSTL